MSFRANSFSRFAKKHGITAKAFPFDPYGLVNNESLKESKDFIVTVSKDDRDYTFTLTFLKYRTELPPLEDILDYLANEAAFMEHFGGRAHGFSQVLEQHASEMAMPFKLLIGPEAYHEFIRITEMRS